MGIVNVTFEPEEGHYQTDDFMAMADFAKNEIDNRARPAIRTQIETLDSYDVIFVGYNNFIASSIKGR